MQTQISLFLEEQSASDHGLHCLRTLQYHNISKRSSAEVWKKPTLFDETFHRGYDMSRVVRKPDFAYAKTKTQISFAVTAKLISAFVFAT